MSVFLVFTDDFFFITQDQFCKILLLFTLSYFGITSERRSAITAFIKSSYEYIEKSKELMIEMQMKSEINFLVPIVKCTLLFITLTYCQVLDNNRRISIFYTALLMSLIDLNRLLYIVETKYNYKSKYSFII